jgi:hypothetical protein
MMFLQLPEWVCFAVTVIFVLIAYEIGYKFGTRRRLKPGENPDSAAGALSGTTLGLLAFMLAFSFNGASSYHDLRKELLIDEANAIRTAYQQSVALPEPYRAEVHGLFQEYLDIRVNALNLSPEELKKALVRTKVIQDELWAMAIQLEQKEKGAPLADKFTESLGKIFDLHVNRVEAAFHTRIPSIIWIVLFSLTFLTMAMMGYRVGLSGARSLFIEVSTALAFSAVLIVIIALDQPLSMLKINPAPLADVLNMVRTGSSLYGK